LTKESSIVNILILVKISYSIGELRYCEAGVYLKLLKKVVINQFFNRVVFVARFAGEEWSSLTKFASSETGLEDSNAGRISIGHTTDTPSTAKHYAPDTIAQHLEATVERQNAGNT
jgi:hypothetical protein